jgi:ATP-dependent RNA helicase RhlE
MSFSDYSIDPFVLKFLTRQGITEPTPIQAKAIPVALEGTDILAISQTGSGKTLAFGLPALTCLDEEEPGNNRMLVLAPTRELAQQVHKVLEKIGRILELRSVCIFGGVSIDRQAAALRRGVDIIVATPGRLIDHMERGNIDFRDLTTLVLDEADRMLDMGFLPDIKRILGALPDRRQTMLFSATFAKEVEMLTKQFMYQPKRIEIGRVAPVNEVRQEKYTVEQAKKPLLLQKILGNPEVKSSIVFMRTKYRTDRITKTLQKSGFKVQAIHGGRTQGQRQRALDGFRKGQYNVLVATDVAARGIDIPGVTHVINFDIPGAYDDYVHRIGRTARASATGEAITFVTKEDAKELRMIETGLGSPIPQVDWVGAIEVDTTRIPKKKAANGQAGNGRTNGAAKSNGRRRSANRPGRGERAAAREETVEGGRKRSSRTERYKRSANRRNNSEESRAEGSNTGRPAKKSSNGSVKGKAKRSNKSSRPATKPAGSKSRPTKGKAARRGPIRQSRRRAANA